MTVAASFRNSLDRATPNGRLSLHGERWAAPICIADAPQGFGEQVWDLEFPTLIAWVIKGSIFSENSGSVGRSNCAGDGRLNLQPRGGPGRYLARGPVRYAHFYLTESLLQRTADGLDLSGFDTGALRDDLVMVSDPVLRGMLDIYSRRSLDQGDPPSRIEMEARALLVTEHLIRRHHLAHHTTPIRGGLAPWQLKRACEAMEAQLDASLSLDELAIVAGCSPTHFSRAFKQSIGIAPFAWLHARRIERAMELLTDPNIRLAEIALAIGFSAQPQFTTAFGKATGLTPGAWRRQRIA